MRFSESWLREWVDPPLSPEQLAHQLSMAGLEVDAVEPVAGNLDDVVIGHIQSIEPHPDADKLRVCQVDVGAGETLQIVCGAANAAAGMKVAVATVGARLSGDFLIKKAKLRGVESLGMICSAAELGLEQQSAGIMHLADDAPLGMSVTEYLQLDDRVIELDLTPDRGDCLSMAGVAREIAVLNGLTAKQPEIAAVAAELHELPEVRLEDAESCPRYSARIIRGIDPEVATPLWMKEKLRRSGLRSLGFVIDVTNFVMLELGQPMHAFDLDRLQLPVSVRGAGDEESLELLDGQTVSLRPGTLLIADQGGPLAMAGVMGGARSAVEPAKTCNLLLESAFFAPEKMMGVARSYGLHTDSSHRFERGVDPFLQEKAIERASGLIVRYAGGRCGPVHSLEQPDRLPETPVIRLRRRSIDRILGISAEQVDVETIMRQLGMRLESAEDGWRVRPPSWRFDVGLEVDLVEEIGRIYGYDNIPIRSGVQHGDFMANPEERIAPIQIQEHLAARGFQEIVSYSFISPEMQQRFDPDTQPIALKNPISRDMGVMRTSLWPSLVATYQYNKSRQQNRFRLFEVGLRFLPDNTGAIDQQPVISGLLGGKINPEHWSDEAVDSDFFDLKGEVEGLLEATGKMDQARFFSEPHPALHPGQSARVYLGTQVIGWLGMLHPSLSKSLDIDEDLYLFELNLQTLTERHLPVFQELSKFPSIRRDLALVVQKSVSYGAIRETISALGSKKIRDIWAFDVYTGNKIDSNLKSIALSLILQDSSGTMTDQETDSLIADVLQSLESSLGAQLRSE